MRGSGRDGGACATDFSGCSRTVELRSFARVHATRVRSAQARSYRGKP